MQILPGHMSQASFRQQYAAREWYLKTAAEDMWSVDDLDRNISTQYYDDGLRLKERVQLCQYLCRSNRSVEYIKNPWWPNLWVSVGTQLFRSELEQALIDNLESSLWNSDVIRFCGKATAYCDRYG
ncbi:hypothetical protein [Phocaeicola vulgatus]|uniref:hypothetical protein n=1 Tax=Phocaeicola vulgatus TaxID=821 RepID=UPI00211DB6D7|nr:hypothetical protein [Phocaeicola vulgatus]